MVKFSFSPEKTAGFHRPDPFFYFRNHCKFLSCFRQPRSAARPRPVYASIMHYMQNIMHIYRIVLRLSFRQKYLNYFAEPLDKGG